MKELDIHPIEGEAEIQRFAEVVGSAFTVPTAEGAPWFRQIGLENLRVAGRGADVVGGLAHLPMGQWFGGRSVPMTGIAGVAVAPESRGSGLARALMASTLTELSEAGVALSALFPATLPLYRACGYEHAGSRFRIGLRVCDVGVAEKSIPIRPATDADRASIESVYESIARRSSGYLDRGDYIWNRVRRSNDEPVASYVVAPEGSVEGYLYAVQKKTTRARHKLIVADMGATTHRAARRLLGFIASDRSLGDDVAWHGGPADAMMGLLPECRFEVTLNEYWMLRVVDVAAALEARGYPAGLDGALELEVADSLIAANHGRFVLTVADGRAAVVRGGTGRLKLDVRGLASLYSGFRDARALRVLGLAEGDDASLDAATTIFASPPPAMPDSF